MTATKQSYIPAIDGLRALAVLSVMIFHLNSNWLPGGFTGVDIFFVISGYVVARSLAGHNHASFSQYIVAFYRRRIVRLFPALLAMLLISSAIVILFIPQAWLSNAINTTGLAAFFGVSNIALALNTETYFSPSVEFNPFVHTWSLGVEEQFYVIFPILFYAWLKQTLKPAVIMLAIASFAASWYYSETNLNASYYLLTSRFWELAAGAMLYQLHSRYNTDNTAATLPAAILGITLIVAGLMLASKSAFPVPWALLPVVGTVLVLHYFVRGKASDAVNQFFSLFPLRYIGKISYSLYLWHWPVYSFFRWSVGLQSITEYVAAFAMTFVPAIASYHLLEQKLSRATPVKNMSAGRTIVAGLAVITLCFTGTYLGFKGQKLVKLSETNDRYEWYPYYSHESALNNNHALQGRTIYVIGDSHAGAYGTMLRMLADETGINAEIHSQGGCGAANMRTPVLVDSNACADQLRSWLEEIRQQANPQDIVFFATLKAYRLTNQYRVEPRTEHEVAEQIHSDKAKADRQHAREETIALMQDIASVTPNIITDAPKPVFSYIPFRCSDWFNQTNPACDTRTTRSTASVKTFRQPVMTSLQAVKQQVPTLTIWDPVPVLCNDSVCPIYDDGTTMYFDGDHLSAHGNRILYPSFKQTIMTMLEQPMAAQHDARQSGQD